MVDKNTVRTAFRDFRRDEATMWALFEEFVTGFYECEQRVYRVYPGRRRVDWADKDAATEANLARIPVMDADVILESAERRIILDSNTKDALARGRGSGTGKLHSRDLYQLLVYVRNRQATSSGPARRHEGILMYPEVSEPLRADIRLEGFRIQARTVNLNRDWCHIHSELLGKDGPVNSPGAQNWMSPGQLSLRENRCRH